LLVPGTGGGGAGKERGHSPINQVGVAEGGQERTQHRLVEAIGVDALGGARLPAIALALVAGVVAIAPAPAVGSPADHVMTAGLAANEAAEQIVGGVRPPPGVILTALDQHLLSGVEEIAVN